MFEWHKKEAPFFTGIARGAGGFGFGRSAEVAGPSGPISATGGTKTGPTGGYFFHYFTTPGPNPFTCNRPIPGARFILVAGGGAGAGGYGGGGGGGGVVYSNGTYAINQGDWIVEVGDGGPSPGPTVLNGSQGSNSNFYQPGSSYPSPTYLRAIGGGGGGVGSGGGPGGGSGGGGGSAVGSNNTQPAANPGVSGIVNAGNAGGIGQNSPPGWTHSGGGGAGGVGAPSPSTTTSGSGGVGLGPPTWSWLTTSFGFNGYFAGGGGGSGYSNNATPANGLGSPDGTGGQAYRSISQNGEPGITNTGGGGGGASTPGPGQPYNTGGGAGGPGAMVIAYPDSL
jgi:hypothetical protein